MADLITEILNFNQADVSAMLKECSYNGFNPAESRVKIAAHFKAKGMTSENIMYLLAGIRNLGVTFNQEKKAARMSKVALGKLTEIIVKAGIKVKQTRSGVTAVMGPDEITLGRVSSCFVDVIVKIGMNPGARGMMSAQARFIPVPYATAGALSVIPDGEANAMLCMVYHSVIMTSVTKGYVSNGWESPLQIIQTQIRSEIISEKEKKAIFAKAKEKYQGEHPYFFGGVSEKLPAQFLAFFKCVKLDNIVGSVMEFLDSRDGASLKGTQQLRTPRREISEREAKYSSAMSPRAPRVRASMRTVQVAPMKATSSQPKIPEELLVASASEEQAEEEQEQDTDFDAQ